MNYYLRKSGVVSGPFPEEDLRRRLTLNLLTSMDEVSQDGRSWKRIRQTTLWNPAAATTATPATTYAGAPGSATPPHRAPTTPASLHLRRIAKQSATNGTSGQMPMVGSNTPSETFSGFAPNPPTSDVHTPSPLPSLISFTPAAPIYRERSRFHNWWLAVAIPCATVVVLAIIGALMGDGTRETSGSDSSSGVSTSGESSGSSETVPSSETDPFGADGDTDDPFGDDGYRGEEIVSLDYSKVEPELRDFYRYITPTYSELKQAFQMILSAEHVSENLAYQSATANVHFYHDPSDCEVNAFATIVDDHRKQLWPTMMVKGGAGRFARIVGAALTENPDIDVDALLTILGRSPQISNEGALEFLRDGLKIPLSRYSDEAWLAQAKLVSRGILMGILAHETGHLALGHVWSWQKNKERNRNQEREADSFAHSIGSGTADAESMFLGQFLFHYAYAIVQGPNGAADRESTHPYAEERLYNLIRDNRSISEKYGITEEDTREQLRKARSNIR